MTTANSSKSPEYQGTNKLIIVIVFGVITYWLFAQALVNVVPALQEDLGVELGTVNITISLSAVFFGIFIVAAGIYIMASSLSGVFWVAISASVYSLILSRE